MQGRAMRRSSVSCCGSDHSARDPRARISGWVCLLVVRVGMDDERGASWLEERGPACRQGHAGGRYVDRTRPVGSHREIRKVSGVGAFGVLVAMLLAVGIEVSARGGEGRRL